MKALQCFKNGAVAAGCVSLAVLLGGCNFLPEELRYFFEPEPTRAPVIQSDPKSLDSRAGAFNAYGYKSLEPNDALTTGYLTLDHYVNLEYSEEFTINGVTLDDFDRILAAYENDHPELFWLSTDSRYSYADNGGSLDISLSFSSTGSELEEKKQELENAVAAFKSEAPDNATDYEMEKFINTYLIDTCDYVDGADNCHTAYGALVNGKAVCDGYSRAFQLLCNRMDIECVTVEGDAAEFNEKVADESDVGHMWNCVFVGDSWYHVDVTWNDGETRIQQYLYFNLSTDEVKKSHTIFPLYGEADPDDWLFLNLWIPDCESEEYNYFERECPKLTDLDEDSDVVAALIEAAENGEEYVDIVIDDALDYDDVVNKVTESYGYSWLSAANYYLSGVQIATDSSFYTYSDVPVITFVLKYKG